MLVLRTDLQAAKRIQGALLQLVPTEDYGLEMAARYVSARENCVLYDFSAPRAGYCRP